MVKSRFAPHLTHSFSRCIPKEPGLYHALCGWRMDYNSCLSEGLTVKKFNSISLIAFSPPVNWQGGGGWIGQSGSQGSKWGGEWPLAKTFLKLIRWGSCWPTRARSWSARGCGPDKWRGCATCWPGSKGSIPLPHATRKTSSLLWKGSFV